MWVLNVIFLLKSGYYILKLTETKSWNENEKKPLGCSKDIF